MVKGYKTQIMVDTREQNPLKFPGDIETISAVLDVGDYAGILEGKIDTARIERKSVPDLFHSFSHNYENEKAKILRAKEAGYHYIIAIEDTCSAVRGGSSYWKHGESHKVKKDGLSMVRQMMTLSRKYGIEVWYCAGRPDMAFRVQEYILTKERAKLDDTQTR